MSLCNLGYCDIGLDDQYQTCQLLPGLENGNYWGAYGYGTSPSNPYNFHYPNGSIIIDTTGYFQNASAGCAYMPEPCVGFPSLTDMTAYIRSLGLTAGFYLNNCVCAEATATFYNQEFAQLLEYGFQNLKVDNCGPERDMSMWTSLFSSSVLANNYVLEACNTQYPNTPGKECLGYSCPFQMYRASQDIRPYWSNILTNRDGILSYATLNLSQPGSWAYGDMLTIGVNPVSWAYSNPGSTATDASFGATEWQSHFSLWCVLSSPLVLSVDLSNPIIAQRVYPIATNTEAIAVNQRYFGFSGATFLPVASTTSSSNVTFFYKPQSWDNSATAVVVCNDGETPATVTLVVSDVPSLQNPQYVRDLWAHTTVALQGGVQLSLAPHQSTFLYLSANSIDAQTYIPRI